MCAKTQEQSVKTVLAKELPKGSSLTGQVPPNGVVSASSSDHGKGCVSAKHAADEVNVRAGKDLSVARCSPVSRAAHALRKTSAVCSLQVPPVAPSKDRAPPSSLVILTLRMPGDVSRHQVINETAHQKLETHSRVSVKACPRFDKLPSTGPLEHFERRSVVAEIGPAVRPNLAFSSSREGEERRIYNTDVSI